jgi:hypothetical protein
VDEPGIRRLADSYRNSQRIIIAWCLGLTQHEHGVETVREIMNPLLRGNIGRGSGAWSRSEATATPRGIAPAASITRRVRKRTDSEEVERTMVTCATSQPSLRQHGSRARKIEAMPQQSHIRIRAAAAIAAVLISLISTGCGDLKSPGPITPVGVESDENKNDRGANEQDENGSDRSAKEQDENTNDCGAKEQDENTNVRGDKEPNGNEADGNEADGNEADGNEADENEADENEADENEADENEPDENEPDENEPDENEPDENEPDENEPDENEDSGGDE